MATDDLEPAPAKSFGLVPPGPLVQIRTYARPAGLTDHTTTRVALRPIAGWRMDFGRFEFDSSFVEPEAALEIPHLTDLHRRFPNSPLSLFGHADPTGDDAYNKELSGRRALAVYGLLVRDVELWEELYQQESIGDRWGLRCVQRMLAVLTDAEGQPYYTGDVDDAFGPLSSAALRRFQEDHGLDADGIPGPLSRAALFSAYMDLLCTHPDGDVLRLTDANFLARGADTDHRGDVQGCSEFNPAMVFSQEAHLAFQAPELREERNRQNAVNRRVVAFFYPDDVQVSLEQWPCPAARTSVPACRERFWSDGDVRRGPQEKQRHFDGDFDTFACRFYHYFGFNSPAETPLHMRNAFDVYLYHEPGKAPLDGRFRLRSSDGTVDLSTPATSAILMQSSIDAEVRCLRLTGLDAGHRYTLSFESAGGEEESVVLAEDFSIEEFVALGSAPKGETAPVVFVVLEDESFLVYEPQDPGGALDWSKGADPKDWTVEQEAVSDEVLPVTLTTITETSDDQRK